MIDLKRKRYLEPVVQKWQKWVCDYFFTVKTGRERPWLTTVTGRVYFDTYADKLHSQLDNVIHVYSRGRAALENRLSALVWLYMKRFRRVIVAKPSQIDAWVDYIKLRPSHLRGLMAMIQDEMVPYYEVLAKEYGHSLVNDLDIQTCPYCNRQFIQSFEAIRSERPELDHFYPKSLYPMFCLSFYNLIPVCHSCNHVKLDDEIGVNPYSRAFNSRFVITDKKKGVKLSPSKIYRLTKKQIGLKLDGKSLDEDKNSRVLGLESVYGEHTDYVKELIDKSMAYDTYAQKALVESFQGAGYHPRQVYDFVWGKHLLDAEYEDRPLSKLTKDVLDLLGIRRG